MTSRAVWVLATAKGLDAASTIVALSLAGGMLYETMIVTRVAIDVFGLVVGTIAVAAVAVVGISIAAELSRELLDRAARLLDVDNYPWGQAFRSVLYGGSSLYYAALAAQNSMLLL